MVSPLIKSFLYLQLGFCAACAGPQVADGPPSWIHSIPQDRNYCYGIGSAAGALYPKDNPVLAYKRAVAHLARQLKTRVVEILTIKSSGSHSYMSKDAAFFVDKSVENAREVERWVDREGRISKRGTVWVLVKAPVPKIN